MNTEKKLQLRVFLKLLWVCIFVLLYSWGGMEFKWLRRFVGPVWLTSGMFVFTRDWRVFLQAPLLMFSLSLGYGADNFIIKIMKRLLFAFTNASTSITHYWDKDINKRDFKVIYILNMVLCCIVIPTLGAMNPMGSARAEELIIGFIIGLLPMFIVKDKCVS